MLEAGAQARASHTRILLAGMLALATAMGIGRFAFTPLLPMMLHEGAVNLAGASWLASANYIGYLLGALLCMLQPWLWARLRIGHSLQATMMVRTGLAATVLLTLGMALPWAAAWPALRLAAGVASALVFVYTSGWCLSQVALRGHTSLGALIYTGPGAGIVLTGLAASGMVGLGWRSTTGWWVFGVLACALTAVVWRVFDPRHSLPVPAPSSGQPSAAPNHPLLELLVLSVAYGLAGFGYIITATFLPVIARQSLPGSIWLDLFWPILGAGVIAGAWLASRSQRARDMRWMLALCYLVQATGIAMGLWLPDRFGFALGSLLVGLPFTAITYFAMQEARRIRPQSVAPTIGLMTALYGLGQIVGPPLAAALLAQAATPAAGFDLALKIAALTLVLGAVMYALLAKAYPVSH